MLELDTLFNLYLNPNSSLSIKAILTLYIIFNAFRIFSYIPQMITLYKEKSSAKAISLITYWMWTGANLMTAIYASVITVDFWLAAISYINTLCCTIICLMVHYKRKKYSSKVINIKTVSFENNLSMSYSEDSVR